MIKLQIGGSPCTNWSIAKGQGREIQPEGIGWELFRNFQIAAERFAPHLILYENNKSTAPAIKNRISAELRLPLQYIDSALVSAQSRQRFYVHNFGDVPQPQDRGILLRDVLESGAMAWREKAYTLRASAGTKQGAGNILRHIQSGGRFGYQGVLEPLFHTIRANVDSKRTHVAEQMSLFETIADSAAWDHCGRRDYEGAPVRVGCLPNANGEIKNNQSKRIYSIDGKSVPLQAASTAGGCSDESSSRTGLYATPFTAIDYAPPEGCDVVSNEQGLRCARKDTGGTMQGYHVGLFSAPKTRTLLAGHAASEKVIIPHETAPGARPVYRVEAGQIEIKGQPYPIKLPDGHYIIRKLTVTECCRLQTLPDDYCRAVSPTQGYKGLGNGWTAEVIIHLLAHGLRGVRKDEPIIVLSMYDGIGTGRYCLDKLGYTNVTYYAYEIDKFARQIAMSNYPGILQCGDAFAVREDEWFLAENRRRAAL